MTEIEKLYSEAFEEGVNYAIQRMFAEDYDPGMDFDGETGRGQYDGKGPKETKTEAKKDNIFKRGWNKFKEDIWETGKGLRDGEGDAKKLNWKRLGKRAGVIAVPTAAVAVPTALAIRHHNKKKAAEAEAEKNYSEGFLDGVGYAQKMFADEEKKDNIFKRGWNKFKEDIWETGKGLRDGEGDAKKLNWKRLGKRAGVIGGGTALVAVPTALAIRSHNKKKAAEAEAEN